MATIADTPLTFMGLDVHQDSISAGQGVPHYQPGQVMLMPPSLDEWRPAEHLARFVDEMVEQHLDLEPFDAAHTNVKGFPPYDRG